jgi:hypothetical protein
VGVEARTRNNGLISKDLLVGEASAPADQVRGTSKRSGDHSFNMKCSIDAHDRHASGRGVIGYAVRLPAGSGGA